MAELIQKYLDDIKIQQYKTDIGFRTLMEVQLINVNRKMKNIFS